MHSRQEHGGLVWIDLESPTRNEIHDVINEFNIPPMVAEELLLPSSKPRIEFHDGLVYAILHFPALRHSHKTREQEMDFVIGKNFLVTTHYDTIDPLHKFSKVFEVHSMLEKDTLGDHAGFLFFYMLKKLYRAVEHEVEYVRHDLTTVEENIFSGHEVEMVMAISRSARDLLNLRQGIEPHREILKELESSGPTFFGDNFIPYLRALSNEYYRVHNHIVRHTDFLHELRETNNSLLTTKQNEVMKTLTVITAIAAPLALVAGLFGISSQYIPIINTPEGFWFVLGLMGIVAGAIVWFFKREKWL
jgi:magnesium transporter